MALAQQINSFGSNHPGLNFLGGLAAGVALTAAATFGALTMQSQNNVEAASFTQTSISQEWSAPRVLVANTGSPISSSDDDAMSASRLIDVRTMGFAAVATEEQTLTAPRVTVSSFGSPVRSSDDDAMSASRLIDVRTMSFATVATEEQTLTAPRVTASNFGSQDISVSAPRTMSSATVATEEQALTAPRVTVSGFGSPVRSSDDDAMSAPRVTIGQPRHGGGPSDDELGASRLLVQ